VIELVEPLTNSVYVAVIDRAIAGEALSPESQADSAKTSSLVRAVGLWTIALMH
jgi:hypothetical protein